MALFGGQRDVSLFRSLNKEMIHRYIDTEVLIYRVNLNATTTNLYDETDNKIYDTPYLVYSVITMEDQQWNADDYGIDNTQNATFAFLRDDLVEKDCHINVGDIIEHKSRFFEVDSLNENQYVVGKNPDNWLAGDSHGYSVSIICQTHMTRQSKVNIVKTRFGNSVSTKNQILPKNL